MVKMIYQKISPLIELHRQITIRLLWFNIRWTRQPNPVITHWCSTTNPGIIPLHQIQHEVIQATACDKYFVTFYNIPLVKSIIQNAPPLLNDTESALHVLANALNVRREIPLG
jgi:hypothetical protein